MRSASVTKDPQEYLELYADVLMHLQLPQPKMRMKFHATKYEVIAEWPCGYVLRSYHEDAAVAAEKALEILIWRSENNKPLPAANGEHE